MVDPAVIPLIQRLDQNPDDVDATTALCKWFLDHDQIAQLAPLLEKIATRRKKPEAAADLWAQAGDLWAKRLNRTDKALPAYQKSLELHAKCIRGLQGLRAVMLYMRKWQTAAELMQRELDAMPDGGVRERVELLKDLADTRAQAEDTPGQMAALEQLVALAPREFDLMRKLAALYVSRSRAADTSEEQKKADRVRAAKHLGTIARAMTGADRSRFAEAALQLNPGDENAFGVLSLAMSEEGRDEELLVRQAQFLHTAENSPNTANVRKNMARIHQKFGRIDAAIEALEPVATTDPEAGQDLALLYQRVGRVDALARLLPSLPLSNDPRARVTELRKRADLALQAGNHDARFALVRELLAVEPTDPEALAAAERDCRARNAFDVMCEIFWTAVRAQGASLELKRAKLREIASLQEQRLGNLEGAVNAWQALLAIDPDNEMASSELERLLNSLGRADELLTLMEKRAASASDPAERRARMLRLAFMHRTRENGLDAEASVLDKLIVLDPDHDEVFAAWCDVRRRQGRMEGLLERARERVERAPDSASRWRTLAGMSEGAELFDDAYRAWQRARTLDPSDVFAWEGEARSLERLDRTAELVQLLIARANHPIAAGTVAGSLYARAAILSRKVGDHATAVAQAERAQRFFPEDDTLRNVLHDGYRALGMTDKLAEMERARAGQLADGPEKLEALRDVARSTSANGSPTDDASWSAWRDVRALARKIGRADDLEALEHLIQRADALGNTVEQVDLLRAATDLVTDRDQRRTLLLQRAGLLANKLSRAEEALAVVTELVERVDPSYAPAWALLGEWALRANDKPLLARALEFRLSRADSSSEQLRLASQLYELYANELQDIDGAIRALEQIHALDPEDHGSLARMCTLYEQRERYEDALRGYETLAHYAAEHTQRTVVAGRILELCEHRLNDPQRALETLAPWARDGHEETRIALRDLAHRHGLIALLDQLVPPPAPITEPPPAPTPITEPPPPPPAPTTEPPPAPVENPFASSAYDVTHRLSAPRTPTIDPSASVPAYEVTHSSALPFEAQSYVEQEPSSERTTVPPPAMPPEETTPATGLPAVQPEPSGHGPWTGSFARPPVPIATPQSYAWRPDPAPVYIPEPEPEPEPEPIDDMIDMEPDEEPAFTAETSPRYRRVMLDALDSLLGRRSPLPRMRPHS